MSSPREVLRLADTIRSKGKRADEAAKLLSVGVGLDLSIGTFRLAQSDHEIRAVIRAALAESAAKWLAEADAIESTVTVSR